MIARQYFLLLAAAIAAVVTLPVAAESMMELDHNPYGYSIVRRNYHDVVLDRYGNVYATEKTYDRYASNNISVESAPDCAAIFYIDDECVVFGRYNYDNILSAGSKVEIVFATLDGNEITIVYKINDLCLREAGYSSAKGTNGLWGIIDKHGKWIIEPSAKDLKKAPFEWCLFGYIKKKDDATDKWGIINTEGEWVVQPQFKNSADIVPFAEDEIYAKLNGKWGKLDAGGNWTVQPQYKNSSDVPRMPLNPDRIYRFCVEKTNQYGTHETKWGYKRGDGTIVIEPKYYGCGDFSEGYAWVEDKFEYPRQKYYINTQGIRVSKNYSEAGDFKRGVAKATASIPESYKSGNTWKTRYNDETCFLISTPATLKEWMELAVMPWEAYSKGKINDLEPLEQFLKRKIEPEINEWQKKGEFESTAEWQKRVNERTRQAKIDALSTTYKDEYSKMLEKHKKDYARVMEDYKKYYNKQFSLYVDARLAEIGFSNDKLTLSTYDADNQTYLISTGCPIGDILLPVPVAEAKKFKEKWNDEFRRYAKLYYVPSGDDMVLASVTFEDAYGKTYTYDGSTKAQYAVTDIDYNFKPVEITLSDEEDVTYTFDPVEVIKQSVVHTSAPKAVGGKKVEVQRKKVVAGTLAEVDKNIPRNPTNAGRNTFAVIIANEDYTQVQPVEFAANDGLTFAKYCNLTLGIPENRVMTHINATYGQILDAVKKLKDLGEAYRGDLNVIFYYAGHGIPDESSKDAFLLPVDANGRNMAACYSLKKLIEEIQGVGARTATVLIDACFSGAQRDKGMILSARGVVIKPRELEPQGNVVVFSATQDDETALPYRDKGHGLFTYYLLKKLQDSKGAATMGELSDYVTDRVRKASVEVNGKLQTPTMRTPIDLEEAWRTWTLK